MTAARAVWAAVKPEDEREATLLLGLSLLAIGLALVWLPAALIVPGAVLTLIALLAYLRPRGEA